MIGGWGRPGAASDCLRYVADRLPGVGLHRRLDELKHGMRAVYLGHDRLLVRISIGRRRFAFVVDASDRLLTPWFVASGRYEVELTRYLTRTVRPSDNCLDVGANFGYFSVLMARLARPGRVIGLEPDPAVARLARDNLRINGLDGPAEVRSCAATADGQPLRLFRRFGRSGNTSIIQSPPSFTDLMDEPPVEPFDAQGVRLDDLLPALDGRVDLIKIDVEGAEHAVLSGASATLADNPKLKLLMEWSPGQLTTAGSRPQAIADLLQPSGFQPYRITRNREIRLEWAELMALPYQAALLFRR